MEEYDFVIEMPDDDSITVLPPVARQPGWRFQPGPMAFTPGIHALLEADKSLVNELADCWQRHCSGDWGDLDPEDRRANNQALRDGSRLLSVYHLHDADQTKIWLITDGAIGPTIEDRYRTTFLLPEEY